MSNEPTEEVAFLSLLTSDSPVLFGLEAQGHIPTIKKMIEEKADWTEIGKQIGWDGETARKYYERYLLREADGSEYSCPKCGAQADERWDCCEVHGLTASELQRM